MRRSMLPWLAAAGFLTLLPAGMAWAQDPPPAATPPALDRPLRVFIDCRGPGCDQEFFRTEITWVDHVRDRKDADVHLLVTAQGTGGGGNAYTLRFIGQSGWEGQEDVLLRSVEAGETNDRRRRMLVQTFGVGLARFAALSPVGPSLQVVAPAIVPAMVKGPTIDTWNFWVFRTNLNVNLNGEATSAFTNVNVNQSANRTTEAWKINVNAGMNYSQSEYELSDGETFTSFRRGWNVNGVVVKSMSPHWSLATRAGASRSTFLNQRLAARVAPGMEYNIFPYSQSTERQLVLQWTVGVSRFRYDEITIFDKLDETRWDETFLAFLSLRQPFGSVSLTTEAAHFFDDASQYRFAFFADTEFRITRGFTLQLDGNYQIIHDQLYLRRGEATNEEIIARQNQLATSYRYGVSVGFTYRFGSINNNVVNPRFGGGPGG